MTNALPPAHWAADPSGRHEYRYWDGTRWTDHVADQGRQGLDPVVNDPTPTAATPTTAVPTPDAAVGTPTDATAPASGSIAWRPDATDSGDAATPDAEGPAPSESVTWPPEPVDEPGGYAAGTGSPAAPAVPTQATTPVVTPAAAAAPVGSTLTPPPPPPTAGTGFVTPGRMSVYGASAWRSMSGLKTALVVLFAGMALASVGLAVTFLNRIAAIDDYQRNPFAGAQPLRDADDAVSGASTIYSILRIAIFVVFIIWMWRASKNALEVMGRDRPKFTPGWSIGSWFIPLANFVIPVMILQGLWRASAPGTAPGTTWREMKGSALIGFYWAAFLVSALASFTFNDNDKLDDVKVADTAGAVGAAASIVAALLAIAVVTQLTRRFEERRIEELGA